MPLIERTAMGLRALTPRGLFGAKWRKAAVLQRDRHGALQQPDDDDPYGDPQSSGLPVQR